MKKLTFIFLFSLLVSSSLVAQVSIGLKIGGAFSGHAFEGIGLGESDFVKPTYLGGVFVSIPLSDNFSIQPEVLYSNKGFRTGHPEIAGRKVGDRIYYNLHYISVPIMLQYRVLDRLTVELGPEFGYLLSADSEIGMFNLFTSSSVSSDPSLSSYRDLDVALNLGVGYALSDRWSVNLRYNLGLRDITNDYTIIAITEVGSLPEPFVVSGSTYNRSVQLSVGYRIF